MRSAWLCFCGALLALAPCAAAVRLEGRVTDDNGRAVAGARVELRALTGEPSTAFTSTAGDFRLELPEPGDYRIHVEKTGFFVYDGRGRFDSGVAQLSVTLNHAREFFQSVDVPYSPPAIDPQETSDTKTLTGVEILEVPYPASQDLRNSLPLLPGVVQDPAGRLHFNGGAADQTNFTLDGFNVSDPVTGRFEARVNIESVRAIDYDGSRFSADKGRGAAGSVDLQTAMGDDRWRFGATNFIPSLATEGGTHFNKWTPRITVSGPLRKGRAWLHNGFDAFYDVDTITGLPKGENRARSLTTSNLTRTQINLRPTNVLTASVLLNRLEDTHRGLSFLDPVETTLNRRTSLYFTSLRDQQFFGRGGIAEFGFADSRGYTRESPQGNAIFEILPSGRRGNYFVDLTGRTRRQQWTADGTLPSIQWFGAHQIRFGGDLQHSSYGRDVERREYRVLREDQSVARVVQFAGSGVAGRRNLEAAEYVQDRWTPSPGLLIEAGLRTGWTQLVRDTYLAPRVAVAWAPALLRDTKFSAGLGVFHDALNLNTFTYQQDQTSFATFFSPAGIPRGPVATGFVVNDRELHVPRYLTLSLSAERKLPLGLNGRATYVRRSGERGLSFFGSAEEFGASPAPAGGLYRLRNWRNDRFDSLELTVRRTFAAHFEWMAGYTASRARSDAVVDYSLEDPIFAPQAPGPLAWDVPHRFVTWGWTPLPNTALPGMLRFLTRDTNLAYLAEYRTGFPFSVVNEEGFLVGDPNRRRFPGYFNVNLHVERRFRFFHYLWAWRFGMNNLTNNGNPNVVNNNIDSPAFLVYGRGQHRAFNVRLRFLGRR